MRKNMVNFNELPLRLTMMLSFTFLFISICVMDVCVCVRESCGATEIIFSDRKMTIVSLFVANELINKLTKRLERRYQTHAQCQLCE